MADPSMYATEPKTYSNLSTTQDAPSPEELNDTIKKIMEKVGVQESPFVKPGTVMFINPQDFDFKRVLPIIPPVPDLDGTPFREITLGYQYSIPLPPSILYDPPNSTPIKSALLSEELVGSQNASNVQMVILAIAVVTVLSFLAIFV